MVLLPKISPEGTPIGGIYAVDKDSSTINPNSRTSCVKIADYETPVEYQR